MHSSLNNNPILFIVNCQNRDLKPDNILLNEHGHAHLTDFNIAVRYSNEKPLSSIAGSMAYMAPDILMKRGYAASVDWWSLGVVCYELLVGKVNSLKHKKNYFRSGITLYRIIYLERKRETEGGEILLFFLGRCRLVKFCLKKEITCLFIKLIYTFCMYYYYLEAIPREIE